MPATSGQPSGIGARIISYLIDSLIFLLVVGIAAAILLPTAVKSGAGLSDTAVSKILIVAPVMLIGWFIYFPFTESSNWQGTLGKKMMGLKVVDMQGCRISLLRSTGRNMVKLICIPAGILKLISFIVMVSNNRRRAIHDFAASTCVERV